VYSHTEFSHNWMGSLNAAVVTSSPLSDAFSQAFKTCYILE